MPKTVQIGPIQISSRLIWRIGSVLSLLIVLISFRGAILRSLGTLLIVEDPPTSVDAIFVLSGNARDRGTEAARLFQAGYAPRIVCLGGERNYFLELFDMLISTAELTKRVVLEQLIPAQSIELLEKGTSTFEEFEAITAMCTARGWKKIMVVSSRFHSR